MLEEVKTPYHLLWFLNGLRFWRRNGLWLRLGLWLWLRLGFWLWLRLGFRWRDRLRFWFRLWWHDRLRVWFHNRWRNGFWFWGWLDRHWLRCDGVLPCGRRRRRGHRGCGDFPDADGRRAASLVDVHELAHERDGVESHAVGEKSHEAASVNGRRDAVEVLSFHFLDDLDEHVRLRRDLRTGEALGLAGGFQCFSE